MDVSGFRIVLLSLVIAAGTAFFMYQQKDNGSTAPSSFAELEAEILLENALEDEAALADSLEAAVNAGSDSAVRELAESSTESSKVALLDTILKSKNDNDPRLDTEFNNLSAKAKKELQEHYKRLPPEDRNGRGTTVFLIGRNIDSPEDFAFLAEVVSESPCLSLTDCDYADELETQDSHTHKHDNAQEITLAYPQIVALKSLERLSEGSDSTRWRKEAQHVVKKAYRHPNPRVRRLAEHVSEKLHLNP